MARREFTKSIYAQIVKRAMLPSGEVACEGCGLVLGKRKFHVDHTKPDALEIDKSRKLTADDGKLLGIEPNSPMNGECSGSVSPPKPALPLLPSQNTIGAA